MDLDSHGNVWKDPPISRLLPFDLNPGKLPPYTQQNEDNKGSKRELREGDLDPVDIGLENTAIHRKFSGTVCENMHRTR